MADMDKCFKSPAAEFVYYRSYARWRDDLRRRETWEETVTRTVDFLKEERPQVPEKVYKKIKKYMLDFSVLPSMRLVWTAGQAARKNNVSIFNCTYAPIIDWKSFSEALFFLMSGCGFGYSVLYKHINQLPSIQPRKGRIEFATVEDSREGWADSVYFLLAKLSQGIDISFDYGALRKRGARLKTFGGRSSGPEPLAVLHQFIRDVFSSAQGRQLRSMECLDILCQIAETTVAGGTRRSSEICLFDINDSKMMHAKDWPFPQRRSMCNISYILEKEPTSAEFLKIWSDMANSRTGEPGFFNLAAAKARAPKRRNAELIEGVNPCGEAALSAWTACCLSSVVLREDDDLDDVFNKIETAVWIGIIQTTFTNFSYLRPEWKTNIERERLLGVSLSGQYDAHHLVSFDNLSAMKAKAIKVAKRAAKMMNINMPSAITLVKPEGTASQLVDSSSGIHPRFAKYYIRRYRISSHDPLCKFLADQGLVLTPDVGQNPENVSTYVVEFPTKSPENSKTVKDVSALDQLFHYNKVMDSWCEHNASCTIYIKDEEWFEVGNWVYKNWSNVIGLTFMPYDGGVYELAPFEEISQEEYEKRIKIFPILDYSLLSEYETDDNTTGAKTLACAGDRCDV
jgi:ribonucleoside-diphosphate reductase alpha chain